MLKYHFAASYVTAEKSKPSPFSCLNIPRCHVNFGLQRSVFSHQTKFHMRFHTYKACANLLHTSNIELRPLSSLHDLPHVSDLVVFFNRTSAYQCHCLCQDPPPALLCPSNLLVDIVCLTLLKDNVCKMEIESSWLCVAGSLVPRTSDLAQHRHINQHFRWVTMSTSMFRLHFSWQPCGVRFFAMHGTASSLTQLQNYWSSALVIWIPLIPWHYEAKEPVQIVENGVLLLPVQLSLVEPEPL